MLRHVRQRHRGQHDVRWRRQLQPECRQHVLRRLCLCPRRWRHDGVMQQQLRQRRRLQPAQLRLQHDDGQMRSRARQPVRHGNRLCIGIVRARRDLLQPRVHGPVRGVQRSGQLRLRERCTAVAPAAVHLRCRPSDVRRIVLRQLGELFVPDGDMRRELVRVQQRNTRGNRNRLGVLERNVYGESGRLRLLHVQRIVGVLRTAVRG